MDGWHKQPYTICGAARFANLAGRQLRYLRIQPKRPDPIASVDLVKGDDDTAPIVMAITAEMP